MYSVYGILKGNAEWSHALNVSVQSSSVNFANYQTIIVSKFTDEDYTETKVWFIYEFSIDIVFRYEGEIRTQYSTW